MLSVPIANDPLGDFDFSAPPISDERICALNLEHDDLDSVIGTLSGAEMRDDLLIARLKKRKLQIRDEIARLLATAHMRGRSEAILPAPQSADGDFHAHWAAIVDSPAPHGVDMEMAPEPAGASFGAALLVTVAILAVLLMGWSGVMDDLSQAIAQIYLLSLLAGANG